MKEDWQPRDPKVQELIDSIGKEETPKIKKIISNKKEVKVKENKLLKKLSSSVSGKVVVKSVLKDKKPTLTIKQVEPAPYVSRFFKDDYESEKRSLFFK